MKKSIAVDMDGVLADVYQQFILKHFNECGETLKLEQLEGLSEAVAFPYLLKHVHSPGFFKTAPLVPGSLEVLLELNQKYDIYIVSAATEFPLSLGEKQDWLHEHFPFIHWMQMVFCGSKKIIHTDIMIDDHFKNLDPFEGKTILFTQPHNKNAASGRHQRVNNWEEIKNILLP
ncbi:MAG: 5'(3')-deoxyribonucleotidase [Cyclobacteriaceae bacterium]